MHGARPLRQDRAMKGESETAGEVRARAPSYSARVTLYAARTTLRACATQARVKLSDARDLAGMRDAGATSSRGIPLNPTYPT